MGSKPKKLSVLLLFVFLLGAVFEVPKASAITDYELLWHETQDFWLSEGVGDLDVAPNGDIVVVGHTYFSPYSSPAFLIYKTDESGTLKWNKTLNYSDTGYAVKVFSNGDILAVGYEYGYFLTSGGITVSRFDSEGNEKWNNIYYLSSSVNFRGMAIDSNGDVIVVGRKYRGPPENEENEKWAPESDIWILRLNENATEKWEKTFDIDGEDFAHGVTIASNGDLVVVGESGSQYFRDFLVLRLDEDGNLIWQNTYTKNNVDIADSVAMASNGDVIVVGQTGDSENALDDIWVVRISSNGALKWEKQFGGDSLDFAYSVRSLSNGDIVVGGHTNSFDNPNGDAWILVLDSSGNVKWNYTRDEGYSETIHSIAIAPNGNLIAAGWSTGDYMDSILLMAIKVPELQSIPYTGTQNTLFLLIKMARTWTNQFFMYHDVFDDMYETAVSLGADNETLEKALELHNNATDLILDAWRCNNIEEVLIKMKHGGIPKLYNIIKALLMEQKAIEILKNAINELRPS